MLLNEFLKEYRKVEEQEQTLQKQDATIANLHKEFQAESIQQQKHFEAKIAQQQEQIEALAAGLRKVNAQVELKKSAPQTVADNQ